VGSSAQSRLPNDLNGLERASNAAINEDRFGDALDALTQAAKLAPRDPVICLLAGYSAFRLGRLPEAETWLERSVTLNPSQLEASILLGQVLYREDKIAEAVAVYEAALKFAPGDQVMTTALDTWRQEPQLKSQFYEARGAHFAVMFDGPANEAVARRIVDVLEHAYWEIGRALSTYPTNPVTVVLYTREQFRDTTRASSWAVGAYDGRIKLPVGGTLPAVDELRRVVEHEFVHAVVATLAGSTAPAWVDEGLATALEPGGIEWATRLLAKDPRRIPLTRLERSFGGMPTEQAQLAYALSAVAVRKMLDLRGAPAIVSLLQALGRGTQFEYAFQQAISMRYEDFATMIGRE
jgi:tetratricopeptide (TPR) repeat protein